MPTDEEREDDQLQNASRDLARQIWQVVLLSRSDARANGLIGKAERMRLVEMIYKLMRVVRGKNK